MQLGQLSLVKHVPSALLVIGLLSGCASAPPDPTKGMTAEAIYAEAKEQMSVGGYDKAISYFDKVEGRAAGTPLAQQAQLDKAYAYYKTQEPAQALVTLDRFLKLHPASPALDYALYLKGLVNFNDDLGLFSGVTRQDLSERDQKASRESYETFRELVQRFPNSGYAPDARLRMNYIVNSLAQYEVHVARYYFSRGAYAAAINRAQTAVNEFRTAPAVEEALYVLTQSYDALGMTQLRDDARRVLELNYPQSEYIKRGFNSKDNPWWKLW